MIASTPLAWLSPARRSWPLVGLALALTGCPSQGDTGPEGPQGPAGDPGVDGPQGNDGPQGFATLIDAVELDRGSGECAYGGTRYDMGLDNGDGGGTANDGILQPGEVDDSSLVCNGSPITSSWEVPSGAVGTATIDARGGNGGTSGGLGGVVEVRSGSTGGPAQAYATGSVDTSFTVPPFDDVYLGTDPLIVGAGQSFTPKIISVGGEAALIEGDVFTYHDTANGPENTPGGTQDLYFRRSGVNVRVTGIRVEAGATLTLPVDTYTGTAALASVPYDIHNSGTITAPMAGLYRYRLGLIARHYYGDPGSQIEQRGGAGTGVTSGGEGGALGIWATNDRQSASSSYQGGFFGCSISMGDGNGGIYNHGTINASAGPSGATATFGYPGASITLCAADETYNTGAITTQGAGASAGGSINLTGGEGGVYNSGTLDTRGSGLGASGGYGGSMILEGAGIVNSGTLLAAGADVPGSCTTSCTGGGGGTLYVTSYGGDIRLGGTFDSHGGNATGTGGNLGTGGRGGVLWARAVDAYDDFLDTTTAAGDIEVGATFSLRGGNGSQSAGYGGEVTVENYGGGGTAAQGQSTSLLGYASIDLSGGNGVNAGPGGTFEVSNMLGMANRAPVSGFAVGASVNTVAVQATGGTGTGAAPTQGGGGGQFRIFAQVPFATATAEVVSRGAVDLGGGDGTRGGSGGHAFLVGSGLIESTGAIDASAGNGSTTDATNGFGGNAGGVFLTSQHNDLGLFGPITLTGGSGYTGGTGGELAASGLEVDVSGNVTATGGAGATASGGEGGYLDVTSSDSFSVVTGTLSVSGGTGTPAGDTGWVWIDGFATQTPAN